MTSGWNDYIQSVIDHSKDGEGVTHVDQVAILSLDGTLLTKDIPTHIPMEAGECAKIAEAFKSNKTDSLASDGLLVAKTKYMFVNSIGDDKELSTILAKAKEHGTISIEKCKTCIIVAHAPDGKQAGQANKALEAVKRHLAQQ